MFHTYQHAFALKLAGILLICLMISANHATAGTCTNIGGIYICSGAASPSDTTQNLWEFYNPIRVETLAGFGIDTAGGDAFFIYSNGELNFYDAVSSAITGAQNGLRASNVGLGPLSISSSGVITGTNGEGLHAENFSNGTDLTISTNTVVGGTNGIVAVNNGSGDLTITANGPTVAGTGIGIWANNSANGGTLNISTADVSAGDDGINAINSGSGQLSITSSGTVSATNDNGISASNSSNGTDLTITTNSVYGGTNGIVATNNGSGDLTITANGTIAAGTGIGVWANNSASGGALNISVADVAAVDDGINAINSGNGQLFITTSGTVSATNDNGIYALNMGGGTTRIDIGSQSIVEGAVSGILLTSPIGSTSTINIYGQVRNLSVLASDRAITATGGSTTVNLMGASSTIGVISLTSSDDTVNLLGSLNGDIQLNAGDDTFIQVGGSTLTGTANGGAGTDTLAFNDMGDVDASSLIATYLNFENLEIQGGTTRFSGDWDFSSGTTTIQAGSLFVNGSLDSSPITVDSAGALGGGGSITGNVVNSGTISPGDSIGTLTVNGDVDFLPGSTYAVELAQGGSGDKLQVNGAVSIAGSTLSIALPQSLYEEGSSWEIIEARSGINGEFATVGQSFGSATLDFQQAYSGGTLSVAIVRTPYEAFGTTANDAAVGASLDALFPQAAGDMENLLLSLDLAMDSGQVSSTLKSLNPEMYTAFTSAGISSVKSFAQAVGRRQQEERTGSVRLPADQKPLWSVWSRVFGGNLDRQESNGVTGYSQDTTGVVFGMDRGLGPSLRAGLLIGYSDSDLEWDGAPHSGQLEGTHYGCYASFASGDYYLDGVAGYADFFNSGKRIITNPAVTAATDSGFDADVWHGALTMGYDSRRDGFTYGPVISLCYHHLSQDGFRESGGGDFSLEVAESDADSFCSSLGLQIQTLRETGEWRFTPWGEVSWLHEFENDATVLSANFVNYQDAAFRVTGSDPIADQGIMKLGLTVEHTTDLSLSLDYALAIAEGQDAQWVSAALAWRF